MQFGKSSASVCVATSRRGIIIADLSIPEIISARISIIVGGVLHQLGTNPQRARVSSRLPLRGNDRVDRCGRADVEARLKVMRRRRQHKPVQRDNLFPRQFIGGAPASRPHGIPRKSRRSISAAKAIPTDRQLRSPLCVRAFLPRDAIHDPRQRLGVAKRRHCAAGHIAYRKRPVCCC
jgi:hypothetical protein